NTHFIAFHFYAHLSFSNFIEHSRMKAICTFLLILSIATIFAQKSNEATEFLPHHHHNGTVCGIGKPMPGFFVPPPAVHRTNAEEALTFEVTYTSSVPTAARTAFERATAILGDLFTSPFPISVQVDARDLDAGVLGGASTGTYLRNFTNAPIQNAWYPIALAEKIARQEFNSSRVPFDITVSYNEDTNWNYTSQNVAANQFDFTTVMLHELLHGMGFANLGDVTDNVGTLRLSGWPSAYGHFLENRARQNLVGEIEDPSVAMGTEMRSNSLFMKTPSFAANNQRVRIFAPSNFSAGSSISHLDRSTFLGTSEGLMSPAISPGSVILNPGNVAINILYDMGWSFTSIIHEPGTGTEDVSQPYVVDATIFSDNGYDPNSVILRYSRDTFQTETAVQMTPTGATDEFTATLPAPNELTQYQYYISVEDDRDITFVSPTEAPTAQFYEYFYDVDDTQPIIVHEPIENLDDQATDLLIEASVTDFFTGVGDVIIEYQINGITQSPAIMQRDLSDGFRPDLYVGFISLPEGGLSEGDELTYRIVAGDKSPARNLISSPESDFYTVSIAKTLDAVQLYVNNFVTDDNDFSGQGFSITQPSRFNDAAIHSLHPYTNAGQQNTRNFFYNLRIPIVLRKIDAMIEFEEIVLVEPGEPDANFGDTEFWDYVIVEGRRVADSEWLPFLDGYDSNANRRWLTHYNSNIQQQNSRAVGEPNLFRDRTIDMLENGNFAAGDTVLVRFRLFSDPFAVGWGWAIDNLRIQDSPVSVEDFIQEQNFRVFPNPVSTGQLTVETDFEKVVKDLQLTLHDVHGRQVYQRRYRPNSQRFRESVAVDFLPKGMYLLTLYLDGTEQISRRVVKH
ncbi:MAG: T9SS type A sorting domain-containing protein, partial [Bacteroidota bacterium]